MTFELSPVSYTILEQAAWDNHIKVPAAALILPAARWQLERHSPLRTLEHFDEPAAAIAAGAQEDDERQAGKGIHMARTAVVLETADYPDSDGLPMAESEFQFWPILYAGSALANHYRARDDVYVVGNLLVYYEKAVGDEPAKSVSPDLMVVFGAPKHIRSSYVLWEEPKAPDFVLEIASSSTYRSDQSSKRDTYETMGVSEYWLYDPTGAYLSPRLQGHRLDRGHYEPLPVTDRADSALTGRSEALCLELRLYPEDRFRFYDSVSGRDLLSLDEEAQARQEAEARLREEQVTRQALEAEIRDLRRCGR